MVFFSNSSHSIGIPVKKFTPLISLVAGLLLVLACGLPVSSGGASIGAPMQTEAAASPAASATACLPSVSVSSSANVRSGPSTAYDALGQLPAGGSAAVHGISSDAGWYYIAFPGGENGYAWVAASVVEATCISPALPVIAAPALPTPVPATATPLPPASPTPIPPTPTTSIPLPGLTLIPLPTATPMLLFPLPLFPTPTKTPMILFPIFPTATKTPMILFPIFPTP